MPLDSLIRPLARLGRARPRLLASAVVLAGLLAAGCGVLETQQRRWIFQATAAPPATVEALAEVARDDGMESVWIEHASRVDGVPIRLHGLWAENDRKDAPVLLYLHGVRRDIAGSTWRIERLRSLGFAVLAIDYRGFGNSTDVLPSEAGVGEDAAAAWRWLAHEHPERRRFVFGHSLGGAVAVQLAAALADAPAELAPRGVVVEGAFTSVGDVFSNLRYGWLPIGFLITERFDALAAVPKVKAPLLVVHGSEDSLVPSRLGEALYRKATAPKRFVLVEGATHSSASWRGQKELRVAMHELFGIL